MSDNLVRTSDWKALKSVYNSAFFCSFGFFVVNFLIPIIAYGYMNASAIEVALVFSMLTLGATIFSPVAGKAAKGRNRRVVIGLGAFSRAIAYVGMAVSVIVLDKYILIWNSLLWGFGAAFYRVGSDAEISERVLEENRAEAFGKREAANGRGSVIGAFVAFAIIFSSPDFGIITAFLFFASSNLLGGLIITVDRHPLKDFVTSPFHDTRSNEVAIGIAALIIAASIDTFISSLLLPFVELFILDRFTQDVIQVALVYLPGGVISGIFGGALGRFAGHQSRVAIVSIAVIVGACSTIGLLFVPFVFVWPISLVSIAILFSISSATGVMAYTVMASVFGTAYHGRASEGFGVFEAAMGVSKFSAPLVGGVLWDLLNPSAPFLLAGLSGFILVPIYAYGMRRFESALFAKNHMNNEVP